MPNDKSKQTAFHRDQAIFLAVVEAASAAERKAILDCKCGSDADLRQRVEALLAAHDAEAALLPAHGSVDETLALEAMAGAMIAGKYKLLQEIGQGGMGVVWMAEQRSPVRRLVAIKLIKAGMDSKTVISRFEAERQALAMMDHPNIARVFDGGITEQGRPYFAMELVRGLPVTEYCDQRRMTVRDRLLLFTQVCHAVQHAHQKGIIHRDIKPGNVLVTEHDGEPVPKVIDFGLAKALGGSGVLTEHTLYTAFGEMAGTPLYTAPEQVAINALDIDTRADIYALGVLLYELLTGSTPLDRERLKLAAWDEVCRVIREEEPPRPSTRISTSLLLPSLAASRQTDPGKLPGLLKGDLDWIILKTLEKERRLRYDTATALVADIERHLNDEPVVAAPPVGCVSGEEVRAKTQDGGAYCRYGCGPARARSRHHNLAMVSRRRKRKHGTAERTGRRSSEKDRRSSENRSRQATQGSRRATQGSRGTTQDGRNTTQGNSIAVAACRTVLVCVQYSVAQRDWEAGNINGARQHFKACREDLRGGNIVTFTSGLPTATKRSDMTVLSLPASPSVQMVASLSRRRNWEPSRCGMQRLAK